MIWVFWTLLGLGLGGILIMAILARRGRPRREAVPLLPRLQRALGISFGGLLWHLSYPLDYRRGGPGPDATRDYTRDFEEKLEEKRRNRPKNDGSPNS